MSTLARVRVWWHRARGHRAYFTASHGTGACNTCDKDFR